MTLFRTLSSFAASLAVLALTGAALIAPSARAGADDALQPFEAEYRVRIKGLRGSMRQSLTASESGYRATATLKPGGLGALLARGSLAESSEFVIVDHGLRPLTYAKRDTIGKNDDTVALDFDWAARAATGTLNDQPLNHALSGQTVDRASLQYALMLDMMHGRSATTYTMLDSERRKQVIVEQAGEGTLSVPFGEFTVHEVRHQTEGSSRRTVLYLAAELNFLPIRIEQYKNDKLRVRADLVAYTPSAT